MEVQGELGGFLVDLTGDVAQDLAELFALEALDEVLQVVVGLVLVGDHTQGPFEILLLDVETIHLESLQIICFCEIFDEVFVVSDSRIGR